MRLIAVILTLTLATVTHAGDYVLGKGGFYWSNGQAYTRSLVSEGYYYRQGCYTYYAPAKYEYTPVINRADFWELIGTAVVADKENASRLEALRLLGYSGQSNAYGGYSQTLAFYGQTAAVYNPRFAEPVDANALLQNYLLGVREVNAAGADALNGAKAVASQVAEQDAQSQYRAFILKLAETARPSATVKTEVRTQQSTNLPTVVQPNVHALGRAEVPAVAQASCLQCHSGANAKGGLDMSDWGKLTPKQYGRMTARVMDGTMPPAAAVKDGSAVAVDRATWLKEVLR